MFRLISFSAAVLILGTLAFAEVVNVAPAGFLVRHETTINAPADKVYTALTSGVGSWWSPAHTYSQDSKNLSIDARPGGCFCEKLPNGGGVSHMTVAFASPGHLLRMTGALGPLQESGIAGSMTWSLTSNATTTKVVLSYSVGGYMQGGFEKIAPIVDAVLGEQFNRFKTYVETGKPALK
ncbi:MAG: SRPBCC domain-containing protein [Acidobacteriia bacterium]|nr:SRPBCC domain-containing protein [Terriglobia bacterium]